MSKGSGNGRAVVAARSKYSFGDRLVVDCPACGGKAVITLLAADQDQIGRASCRERV